MHDVTDVVGDRLVPTLMINIYSLIFSVPIGIMFGIFAALKKNKWQDHAISTGVMLFISVPSFVYAFVVQYFLGFKWNLLPPIAASLKEAGGTYFSWTMFKSWILPVLALSFGTIASLCRNTRAELTEALTSEYMLLARTKGLTKAQAITRHALKNAMVPIFPGIIGAFVSILSGSLIIEQIFAVPGVGRLYITALTLRDYDVFMFDTAFYTFIGLASNILIDLSYGFLDPRVRMGASR
jgi:ABC-type dipeptide/oligopeptide/nickel transport system permease component